MGIGYAARFGQSPYEGLDNIGSTYNESLPLDVALEADKNTLAFAIGAYPDTFTIVPLVIPTN